MDIPIFSCDSTIFCQLTESAVCGMVLRNKFVNFSVQSDHDLSMFWISIVTEVDSRYSRACTVYTVRRDHWQCGDHRAVEQLPVLLHSVPATGR